MKTKQQKQRDAELALARYRKDPERHRKLSLEYYHRHRERLLAERKIKLDNESPADREKRLSARRAGDRLRYKIRGEAQKAVLRERYATDDQYRFKALERNFVKKYGLDWGGWKRMFHEQNGHCLGCDALLGTGRAVHIDHCHTSNKVRGLLCSKCNRVLGCVGDRVATLERLAKYLRRCPSLGGVEHSHEDMPDSATVRRKELMKKLKRPA